LSSGGGGNDNPIGNIYDIISIGVYNFVGAVENNSQLGTIPARTS